jgi:hypothetical protein
MRKLIKNSIMTPDGTILTSRHRHDYQSHKDKNSEIYVNDGGIDYLKRSINKEPYIDLSLYSDDSFEKLRGGIEWGSRGKNGEEELHFKSISSMSTKHINNILSQFILADYMKELFEKEISHRNKCRQKGLVESHWEED